MLRNIEPFLTKKGWKSSYISVNRIVQHLLKLDLKQKSQKHDLINESTGSSPGALASKQEFPCLEAHVEDKSNTTAGLVWAHHTPNTLPAECENSRQKIITILVSLNSSPPLCCLPQVGTQRNRVKMGLTQKFSSHSQRQRSAPWVSPGSIFWPDASCPMTSRKNTTLTSQTTLAQTVS